MMKSTHQTPEQGRPGPIVLEDDAEQSLPLMGGVGRPEGLPEAMEMVDQTFSSRRLMNQGTLLLVGIVVVAAGTLWGMRLGQGEVKVQAAQEVEARIEDALSRLSQPQAMDPQDPLQPDNLQGLFQNTNSVIAMFSTDVSQRQVPVDQLKKNPFLFPMVRRAQVVPTAGAQAQQREAERRRQEQRRALESEFKGLKLQTVVTGRDPMAIINGQVLRVGHTLGSFTVTAVERMGVTLKAGEYQFTLSLAGEDVGGDVLPLHR